MWFQYQGKLIGSLPQELYLKLMLMQLCRKLGGAAAAFCRDNDGTYLGASVVVFVGITDPATLEALACHEALALAEDLALQRLFVVSDCKTVVSEIGEGTLGSYGSIIAEINSRTALFN